MSRVCAITSKKVMSGNRVSHANNKTRRFFLPNIQSVRFLSTQLGIKITMKVSMNGFRTVQKYGGIDEYVQSKPLSKLPKELHFLKKIFIKQKQSAV